MIRELNISFQIIRDIGVLFASISIIANNYNLVLADAIARFIFVVSATLVVLSVINLYLIYTRTKSNFYFYLNTTIQLIPSAFVAPYLLLGIIYFALNVAILVTLIIILLGERKKRKLGIAN